jgi:hypothetical protein
MKIYPFLNRLKEDCPETVQRLSRYAVGTKFVAQNDYLFLPGERATSMYIVSDGQLSYARTDRNKDLHREQVDQNEDWIAEPILWTHKWIHLGMLSANKESALLLIFPEPFQKTVSLNPHAFWLGCRYASSFMQWLNDLAPEVLSDITQGETMSSMLEGFIPCFEAGMWESENDHVLQSDPCAFEEDLAWQDPK